MQQPLVSICSLVYNHESYLRQCLDGFVMQKTTFPFEVVIHDDASTDGSADIIREYAERYPDVFVPIYQTENQYSKGIKVSSTFVFPRARGKYIALCEGDDYWTDPLKLQKQVDFLEANPDMTLCFHAYDRYYQNGLCESIYRYPHNNQACSMQNIIMGGGGFMATNSMVFLRAAICDYPEWAKQAPVGDLPLMLVLASRGNVGYINEVCSAYRFQTPGSWSSQMNSVKKQVLLYQQVNKVWKAFDAWTNRRYSWSVTRVRMRNYKLILKLKLYNALKSLTTI